MRFEVSTPLGSVWLDGRDTGKPLLLMLAGLFTPHDLGEGLQAAFPNVDVLHGRIPGDAAPPMPELSVERIAQAYLDALASRFPGRPAVVLGNSAGGLVGIAMARTPIAHVVALDPPLRTGDLWPLRHELVQTDLPGWEALAGPLFGITRDGNAPRDYLPLLAGVQCPVTVLCGGEPLYPERPFSVTPSLVDEASRQAVRDHPRAELWVLHGVGHVLTRGGQPVIARELGKALASAFSAEAASRG